MFEKALDVKISATNVTKTRNENNSRDKFRVRNIGRRTKKRHELRSQFVRCHKIPPGVHFDNLLSQLSVRNIGSGIIDENMKSVVIFFRDIFNLF